MKARNNYQQCVNMVVTVVWLHSADSYVETNDCLIYTQFLPKISQLIETCQRVKRTFSTQTSAVNKVSHKFDKSEHEKPWNFRVSGYFAKVPAKPSSTLTIPAMTDRRRAVDVATAKRRPQQKRDRVDVASPTTRRLINRVCIRPNCFRRLHLVCRRCGAAATTLTFRAVV